VCEETGDIDRFTPSRGIRVKLPISCFIITKNEADRIVPTIRSVSDWVSEVIVVDSGSTDGTQEIAASAGASVTFRAWTGFGPQKRFGESLCKHDWVLNIDADEVVSPELALEIQEMFAKGLPPLAAYALRINDVYPGWTKPRWGANDHLNARLYDRRKVQFKDSPIHDSVDTRGHKVGKLKAEVHHRSARTFDDALAKSIDRGKVFADHAAKRSILSLRIRLVFEFPLAFIKFYFFRRHVTGGLAGFQMAMFGAISRFVRIVRMLELAEKARASGPDTPSAK
jgi:glycosyltransferase involved in cell wall biosynthesis